MPSVHMMIGNIRSGKSEFAEHLSKTIDNAVVVDMDSITEMFHKGYGSYKESMKTLYQKTEETAIKTALENNIDVIIDRTNVDKKRRAKFIEICKNYTDEIIAYQFPVNTKHLIKQRMDGGRGVSQKTWDSVADRMWCAFEEPDISEGFSQIVNCKNVDHEFLAVDFDGTIVGHEFPDIGAPIQATIDFMNEFWKKSIWNRIIIWSCRSGEYEHLMREWLIKNRVPFDWINKNPIVDLGGNKIFANQYLDDRNLLMDK